MVFIQDADDPVEQHLALFWCQILDRYRVLTQGINRLPSRDRIRAHKGLFVSEVKAGVLRTATVFGIQIGVVCSHCVLQ